MIDASLGTGTLLASDLSSPVGLAYDPTTLRLYVSEQSGERRIWIITWDGDDASSQSLVGQSESSIPLEKVPTSFSQLRCSPPHS